MQFEIACACGKKMRASAEHMGKRARCPKCGALVKIVGDASSQAASSQGASVSRQPSPPSAGASAARPARQIVTATVVQQQQQTSSAFDPLDFGDLSFPASTAPAAQPQSGAAWSGSAWSAGGSAAPARGRSAGNRRRVWIGLAIAGVCLIAFTGFGVLAYALVQMGSGMSGQASGRSGSGGFGAGSAATKKTVPEGPPVTEAEAEAVVQRFVAAVNGRDFNLCKQLFPVVKMYEGIADDAQLVGVARRAFVNSANSQSQIWEQVHEHTRAGGEYVVLRPMQRGGEMRVIVRFSSEQSGLNYHEYIVRRNERQEAEIADVYIMASGSTLSDSISQLVVAMLGTRDSKLLGRLGNKQAAESGERLSRIKTLMSTDPDAALREFDKFPAELQTEKNVMVMKLLVCSLAGAEKYAACFEEFQRKFPGDACIDLLAIDYHLNRNDNANAAASAQRLNAFVGGDPMLEQFISSLSAQ